MTGTGEEIERRIKHAADQPLRAAKSHLDHNADGKMVNSDPPG